MSFSAPTVSRIRVAAALALKAGPINGSQDYDWLAATLALPHTAGPTIIILAARRLLDLALLLAVAQAAAVALGAVLGERLGLQVLGRALLEVQDELEV